MSIRKVRLVYFSPTRTTKKILEGVAEGIGVNSVDVMDMTYPGEQDFPHMEKDELLVMGAPVYAGRVASTAVQRFRGIKSNRSPAVLIVLYGNREYEDALLELSDLAIEAGFVPIAGGAFIGEHSFSSAAIPLARGRPDAADLRCAWEFGKALRDSLDGMRDISALPRLQFPGNRPFREYGRLPPTSPVIERDRCIACGICVSVCPTGSICLEAGSPTNSETCILCCACVRFCPNHARSFQSPHIDQIIDRLRSHTVQRKEPELFFTTGK